MNIDIKFVIKSGDGQITFPIYRVPVSGSAVREEAADITNLQVALDRQVLEASQSGIDVVAAYSDVAVGKHQIVITGAINNTAFAIVYGVRAEESGYPAEITAPSAYISLAPTGGGSIEDQLKDLQDRMTVVEGEVQVITQTYATKAELQATLGEIQAAIEALPDGQAVSATVARHTLQIEELNEKKADKTGNYPLMTVGKAKNIDGNLVVEGAFMERVTGGADDADIANGVAQLTEVKGQSVRFNQLTKLGSTTTAGGVTRTVINDCTVRLQGIAENRYTNIKGSNATNVNVKNGHKYYSNAVLIAGSVPEGAKITSNGGCFRDVTTESPVGSQIFTATEDYSNGSWQLSLPTSYATITLDMTLVLTVHDLTDIFGAGNEPETTAAFEAWLAMNAGKQPWFPWTTGTLMNVGMEGIVATGFNLLNPTTGKAAIIGAYSSLYGNYYGIVGTYTSLSFTDIYGRISTVTPDSDGKFVLTEAGELTVTGAGDDCAVFLWWDGNRKDYEPYKVSGAYVDVKKIKGLQDGTGTLESVFPNGIAGWGYNFDHIYAEGATVAIGSRAYAEGDENDPAVLTDGTNTLYVLPTPKFYPASSLVYVGSSYHEDNTPVTIPANYEVDNWGIEQIVPANSGALNTAAPVVLCVYSPDVLEILDTHSEEIANNGERIEALEEGRGEFARKSGNYPEMSVGLADNLEGDKLSIDGGYVMRPFGTGSEVADGQVRMTEIRGRAVAWNQLVQNGNEEKNGDRVQYGGFSYTCGEPIIGHKYFVISTVKSDGNYIVVNCFDDWASSFQLSGIANTYKTFSNIFTCTSPAASGDARTRVRILNYGSRTINIGCKDVELIDLTLLCGAGNEPTTVAGVEAYLASRRRLAPYYAQNAGQLLGARFKGWSMPRTLNLLNPTTKQARLPEYSYTGHDNEFTVVGFENLTNAALQFTPDKTGVAEVVTLGANNRFVIPSTGTLEVVADGGDITGDVASVCVLMTWDGTKDTEYQPFEEFTSDLDSANIYYDDNGTKRQAFDGGVLRWAGESVYDSLKPNIVSKKWEAEAEVLQEIDLGSLMWSNYSVEATISYPNGQASAAIDNQVKSNGVYIATNYIMSSDWSTDKSLRLVQHTIYVKDSSFFGKTGEQVATSLSGVKIWAELATPITHTNLYYKIGDDIYVPLEDVLPIDGLQGYGCNWATESLTEMSLDANGQPQAITPDVTEVFNEDLKEGLKTLLDEREGMITVADMKAQLQAQGEALKSAGLITGYTLTDPSADSKVIGISYTTA